MRGDRTGPDISAGQNDATILPGASDENAPVYLMDRRYRVERVIGEGAFGRVYLAFDSRLRRNVAIKQLLASHSAADADVYARYLERFHREARAAGVVQHPNIAAVLELAIDRENTYYLIMEYIDGFNLRGLLSHVQTLPTERAVQVTLEVARALEAVHQQDIVHRDLKPANIMLTRRGVVKLTDFGVAQVGHESQRTQLASGHPGTPLYMSPEQASGRGYIDGRSDLYSLGLILYEMLTGKPYARLREPLELLRPDLPSDLVAIYDRLTAEDPNARYAHAGEVVTALSQLSSAHPALGAIESFPLTILDGYDADGYGSQASSARRSTSPPASYAARNAPNPYLSGSPAVSSANPSRPPPEFVRSNDALSPSLPVAKRQNRSRLLGIGAGVVTLSVLIVVLAIIARGHTGSPPAPQATSAIVSPPVAPVLTGTNVATSEPATAVLPTATQDAPTARALPTSVNGMGFSQWATSEVAGLYRRSFDPAMSEYHVTLLKENAIQPIFSPDGQSIADLLLDVDVRQVAGPDTGGYGLAFRVQPIGPGEKSHAAYIFVINGQQRYAFYQMNADGTSVFIQPFTALPAGKMNTGPNAVNHLTVLCRGDQITLAVNGTTLSTYTAAITRPGIVGIAIETPTAIRDVEVAFRNLRVSPL